MSGTNVVIPVEEISAYPVNHLRNAGVQHTAIIGAVTILIKTGHPIPKEIMFVIISVHGIGTKIVSVLILEKLSLLVMIVPPVRPVGYV